MPNQKKSSVSTSDLIHIYVTPTAEMGKEYALSAEKCGQSQARFGPAKKELLTSVLSEIESRVRFIDPVLFEAAREGQSDLGHFPVLPLDVPSLAAIYIAILCERDLVALSQVLWPDIRNNAKLRNLAKLCSFNEDFCSAAQDYLQPRIEGALVSAPFEFLPYSPRGQYLALAAMRSPSHSDRKNSKPTFHLGCYWYAGESSLYSAPKVAWQAVEIVENYFEAFNEEVRAEAIQENLAELVDVEVFPQVSPFGLASLWLAALRHENLVVSKKSAWPAIMPDDLLYLSTFGDDYTKLLVEKYLAPAVRNHAPRSG